MIQLNKDTKTFICIGTGGVGKTTMAATLALGQSQLGRRVLVLTIDPSQRLAEALGFKCDGEVYKISDHLFACTINHEKVFSEFINKASSNSMSAEDRSKLLKNKLYQQLSTNLSGSQEFTSLFKLNDFVRSGQYDLVILDTPPAQHTWVFLQAPQKIAQLFNETVAHWFREQDEKSIGVFKKIFNAGTEQVFKVLEKLTGSEFIKELALFFKAIQKWQVPLENQVLDCHRLLTSKTTEFILVTALDQNRLLEAEKLYQEIFTEGYNLTHIIVNRVPKWLGDGAAEESSSIQKIRQYYSSLWLSLKTINQRFGSRTTILMAPELENVEILKSDLEKSYSELTIIK